MLDQIIQNFSNQNLLSFFQQKIASFKPEKDIFNNIIPEKSLFTNPEKIGESELNGHEELMVFTCFYEGELSSRSAKKKQFGMAKKVLTEDFKDGAIFIFHDKKGNFRFSFIRKNYGDETSKYSNWKRFTYFVTTAKQNKTFKNRIGNCSFDSLDKIQEAFSVEPLSKEFYKDLSYWYFWALQEVEFPNDGGENENTLKSNAMIRLITRLIFVWFMKQKHLIADDLFDKEKLDKLINHDDPNGSTYYKAILQNLFFATLNTPKDSSGRKFVKDFQGKSHQRGIQNYYRYEDYFKDPERFIELMDRIPFLNGGLFENLDVRNEDNSIKQLIDCFSNPKKNRKRLRVPDYLFFGESNADVSNFLKNNKLDNVKVVGLIDLLKRYDFTIDENTPYDQEVALDPELLGLVFENLLASYNPESKDTARKESGSFYTPREIVDYMVEESLVHNMLSKTGYEEEKLRKLFRSGNDQPFGEKEERRTIISGLSELKILDPACGSGAFPMGALQKMTFVLSKLDQDNSIWKETQKQIAIKETIDAYENTDEEERKARLQTIERNFADGQNEPDYARKLYLMENCLYGVDIQPIAMQIAKLRFFISLLVEQRLDKKKKNLGIIALPNLETKFVAANSLKGLPGKKNTTGQLSFKTDDIIKLEKDLETVRHKHFSARTPKTKKKYRQKDQDIRDEIAKHLDDALTSDAVHAITNWNPYNANSSAEWFDPEWMFGIEDFDLVIGNPPYIQLQKALPGDEKLKYGDLYKTEGYETFARTGDIYGLFYEQGLNLAKNKGLLCYITSNKWMRAGYGKKLRKFLSDKKPLVLLDLGPGIFESATVDVNILLAENSSTKKDSLKAKVIRTKTQIDQLEDTEFTLLKDLGEESWVVLSPIEQSIKEKIERIGTPLKDWDINIYRGVLTGYNKAFIIDGQKRKELIDQDPKSAEIIRPILRGRDIKKYNYDFADLWLINTHNGIKSKGLKSIDIDDYPAIKKHLDQFYPQLKKRRDQGVTPYNLRNCAYMKDFYKQKIVYNDITQKLTFGLAETGVFFNNTVYSISSNEYNLNYLLGFLNSPLMDWYYKTLSVQLGEKAVRLFSIYVKRIPVIPISKNKDIVENVKKILLNPAESDEFTSILNEKIYQSYDLSEKEIQFIESL